MSEEMPPDSTKALLDANHAAVLREFDSVNRQLGSIRTDMSTDRTALTQHNRDDSARFGDIDRGLSVLKWGYALGAVIFASGFVVLLKMLMGG